MKPGSLYELQCFLGFRHSLLFHFCSLCYLGGPSLMTWVFKSRKLFLAVVKARYDCRRLVREGQCEGN